MTLPASLEMGNMTRLRNLEYMEAASGFRLPASGSRLRAELSSPAESRILASCSELIPYATDFSERREPKAESRSSCFHEKKPLSRRASSLNSPFKRSRRRKPE